MWWWLKRKLHRWVLFWLFIPVDSEEVPCDPDDGLEHEERELLEHLEDIRQSCSIRMARDVILLLAVLPLILSSIFGYWVAMVIGLITVICLEAGTNWLRHGIYKTQREEAVNHCARVPGHQEIMADLLRKKIELSHEVFDLAVCALLAKDVADDCYFHRVEIAKLGQTNSMMADLIKPWSPGKSQWQCDTIEVFHNLSGIASNGSSPDQLTQAVQILLSDPDFRPSSLAEITRESILRHVLPKKRDRESLERGISRVEAPADGRERGLSRMDGNDTKEQVDVSA